MARNESRGDQSAGGLKIGNATYDIRTIPYDHKANAAEATTVANRLVFQDKVSYIVGNSIGATTTAAQTITEPNKVLFLFVSWGKQSLGPQYPYSFRETFSDVEVVEPFYLRSRSRRSFRCVAGCERPGGKTTGNDGRTVTRLKILADEYFDRVDGFPCLIASSP